MDDWDKGYMVGFATATLLIIAVVFTLSVMV
jgi:hypothetical protein